jgi:F-type H+-transporting ATPase subunit b
MATSIFLATESAGFGLNTDIFEANLVNLAIVGTIVFIFGKKFLTKTLGERRDRIEAALTDAEKRQKQAETALAEAKKQLAAAQKRSCYQRCERQGGSNGQGCSGYRTSEAGG